MAGGPAIIDYVTQTLIGVLDGKILPEGSAFKQTLTRRRKRLREAVKERLAEHGWQECGVNVYRNGAGQS